MTRKIQFANNHIYHLFNRGVEKRTIFQDDNDRWRFLQGLCLFNDVESSAKVLWELENRREGANLRTIRKFLEQERRKREPLVRIMADCLMPNHYHLLVEQLVDEGISRFMQKLGTGYVKYFNQKHEKRVGGLFQGRFKAVLVEEELYLRHLLVYINAVNPAELVEPKLKEEGIKDVEKVSKFVDNYVWGTHPEYLQTRDSFIIDKGILGELFPDPKYYRNFVQDSLLEKKYHTIDHLSLE